MGRGDQGRQYQAGVTAHRFHANVGAGVCTRDSFGKIMLGIHELWLFILSGLLLNITPGPDTAYIVGRSVQLGWRGGAAAALGISAGCLVHVFAAAIGLSALLAASSAAFTLVKWWI